ncbi:hypothetical protein LTS18_006955, partial [Coniosporium uncinatum]
ARPYPSIRLLRSKFSEFYDPSEEYDASSYYHDDGHSAYATADTVSRARSYPLYDNESSTSSTLRALGLEGDDDRLWRRSGSRGRGVETYEEDQYKKAKEKEAEFESEMKRAWKYVHGRLKDGWGIDPNTLGKNECLFAMKYVVDELDVLDDSYRVHGRRQDVASAEREKRRAMLKEAAWSHIGGNLMEYVGRIEDEIFPQFKHRDLLVFRRALAEVLQEWRRRQEAEKRRQ